MLSKSITRLVRSLEHKKYRVREQLFVAEGPKVVGDLLARFQPQYVMATDRWTPPADLAVDCRLLTVSVDELRRLSFLQHPQEVMALFRLPGEVPPAGRSSLTLVLDGVQDPGNVGTIIRTADWFGIDHIVCSRDTADAYAPKVVQATMGSLARVSLTYTDLPAYLLHARRDGTPLYGTFLDGDSIYTTHLSPGATIVMGNEGKGISPDVARLLTHRLTIPSCSAAHGESLNVAIAAALVCAEFRRADV